MINIIITVVAVVILSLTLIFSSNDESKNLNNDNHENKQVMTSDEISELKEQIDYLRNRLSSITNLTTNDNEISDLKNKLSSLTKKLIAKQKNTKEIKEVKKDNDNNATKTITGYQNVYEYIEKHDLKPVYEEVKELKDGTPYNIYADKVKRNDKDSSTPPASPVESLVYVYGQKVYAMVDPNTQKVAVLTTSNQDEQELTVMDLTNESSDVSSPPLPPAPDSSTVLPTTMNLN